MENLSMTRGYIVIVQNNVDHDYLRLTYALALSLKATQKENAICVCVDEYTKSLLTDKHYAIFDHVVDIPWGDEAEDEKWKIHNKWKYIHMSPFDQTIILDSDVIFTKSVDHWWDLLSARNLWLCTNVKTFKNEDVTSDYYRTKFTELELPNIYSNFTYFDKSELSYKFFEFVEDIMMNWEDYYDEYLYGSGQDWISADLAYALAVKIMGIEEQVCDYHIKSYPTFVHMKSYIQNIPKHKISPVWHNDISSDLSAERLIIGNFEQTLPFHYVEKDWLTDEIIKIYEDKL
jgi:hypothetical protein